MYRDFTEYSFPKKSNDDTLYNFLLSDFSRYDNDCEFYFRDETTGELFPIIDYYHFRFAYDSNTVPIYKMIRPSYSLKVKKILFWKSIKKEITGYIMQRIN